MSVTLTSGRPVPNRDQELPPFVETYSPRCVPAYTVVGCSGSTFTTLTGIPNGSPLLTSMAVNEAPPSVDFQTCEAAASGATDDRYTMDGLVGTKATDCIDGEFFGTSAACVHDAPPLWVTKTRPPLPAIPTVFKSLGATPTLRMMRFAGRPVVPIDAQWPA